jgi:predicted RNA-binding Zn-ribbon protein involved in translation (DUF1610 family)
MVGTSIWADVESETRFQCPSCDEFYEEEELETVYECTSCGTVFNRSESNEDNHKCPNCNKFASLLTKSGGPCLDHEECEEVLGAECPECGDWVKEEEWIPHEVEHVRASTERA